jgi:hypothetical protein
MINIIKIISFSLPFLSSIKEKIVLLIDKKKVQNAKTSPKMQTKP